MITVYALMAQVFSDADIFRSCTQSSVCVMPRMQCKNGQRTFIHIIGPHLIQFNYLVSSVASSVDLLSRK